MNKYYKNSNLNHNIYSNNDVVKNAKYYGDLIEERFNKSYLNIYHKSPSEMSKYSSKVIDKNQLEFFSVAELEKDNIKTGKSEKAKWKKDDLHNDNIASGDMLDYQFSSMKFDNSSNPISHNGKDNAMQLFDIRNKRTYGVVDEDKMTHNNMVPYFKLKGNYGNSPDEEKHMNDTFNRKLNLFTGSLNNLQHRPKTERKPLFSPVPGLTNIYGSPVKTDQYEGRYIPGKERRNEKPFQEVKVTPGLNLGYNDVGYQGFHDPFRAMPKNIDETRTLNNPKISYNNPMGGKLVKKVNKKNHIKTNDYVEHFSNIEDQPVIVGEYETEGINGFYAPGGGKRSVDPVVVKRHPDRFKEYGYDRHLPTAAYRSKPANYGYVNQSNLATVNRGLKDTTHTGGATMNIGHAVGGEVDSSKEQYLHDGPSNTKGHSESYTINYSNATPAPTNRNTYNYDDVGNAKNVDKSYVINYDLATPDATKRNMYNVNDTGNTKGHNESYSINYSLATPAPTNRNTYNVNDSGNAKGHSESYAINYDNATPGPTNRNMYNYNDVSGANGYDKGYTVNYDLATPGPTNRNMYNYNDIHGIDGYDKGYVINYDLATPDPTNRNMYNVDDSFKPAKGHNENRSRMDANNMRQNIVRDIYTVVPHGPVKCNYNKIPTMENTQFVSNHHKLQINREYYPDIEQRVAGMDYPQIYAKKTVPNDEYHFNSYVLENLQGNPYVNDTQNKADYVIEEWPRE